MVKVSLLENPIVIPSAAAFDSIYSGSFWKHLSDGTWFTLPLISVPFNKQINAEKCHISYKLSQLKKKKKEVRSGGLSHTWSSLRQTSNAEKGPKVIFHCFKSDQKNP